MSSQVQPKQEDMQPPTALQEGIRWEMFHDVAPPTRSREETEALIERLNANLNARMADSPNIPDSLATLHRVRAGRARYLRRR